MKNYILKKTNRKTVALLINKDGGLIVKAPFNVSEKEIEEIITRKRRWIEEKQKLINDRKKLYREHHFLQGEEFLYLGNKYFLKYSNNVKSIIIKEDIMYISSSIKDKKSAIITWYKKAALYFLKERVSYYEKITGVKIKSIKITSARRQWGSCGREGNINFSWRLIMCPVEAIDYVILHEIIHILHPNHSKFFYSCLEQYMPDYKNFKQWLVDNQQIMDII